MASGTGWSSAGLWTYVRRCGQPARRTASRTSPIRSRSPGVSMRAIINMPARPNTTSGSQEASSGEMRMRARSRVGQADVGEVIAEKSQQNRPDVSAGPAASARRGAERNAHQRQHDAGERQREAAVQFHARVDVFLRSPRVRGDESHQLFREHFLVRLGASAPAADSAAAPWCRAARGCDTGPHARSGRAW